MDVSICWGPMPLTDIPNAGHGSLLHLSKTCGLLQSMSTQDEQNGKRLDYVRALSKGIKQPSSVAAQTLSLYDGLLDGGLQLNVCGPARCASQPVSRLRSFRCRYIKGAHSGRV